MRTVVAFTANDRPNYMREVLESWRQVRGIEDALLYFRCEPWCPEMVEVCKSVDFAETIVHVNGGREGVQRNPFKAINWCFTNRETHRQDDFIILAEDDFIVATDTLEWFAWSRKTFFDDPNVLCVSANQYDAQSGGLGQALFLPWFPGWVWGTWRDRWEQRLEPDWTFNYEHNGWDWRMTNYWCEQVHNVCLAPALSRSQHIGEHGGVHTIPGQWFLDQQSRCFQQDVPPQAYRPPTGVSMIRNPRG